MARPPVRGNGGANVDLAHSSWEDFARRTRDRPGNTGIDPDDRGPVRRDEGDENSILRTSSDEAAVEDRALVVGEDMTDCSTREAHRRVGVVPVEVHHRGKRFGHLPEGVAVLVLREGVRAVIRCGRRGAGYLLGHGPRAGRKSHRLQEALGSVAGLRLRQSAPGMRHATAGARALWAAGARCERERNPQCQEYSDYRNDENPPAAHPALRLFDQGIELDREL